MPGSNRGIVFAAIIGIAVICFGLGAYLTALTYPKQELYQSFGAIGQVQPAAADANSQFSAATLHRVPCVNPRANSESDLCAQWRAALAAEKAAEWTKWGVVASALGISLLLWQITLTIKAVKDTGEATKAMNRANEIAQDSAKRQLRAYLAVFESKLIFPTPELNHFGCQIELRNTGQTPAYDVRSVVTAVWDKRSSLGDVIESPVTISDGDGQAIVGPNCSISSFCPIGMQIYNNLPQTVASDMLLFIKGRATYSDVFGDNQELNFAYSVQINPIDSRVEILMWPTGNFAT